MTTPTEARALAATLRARNDPEHAAYHDAAAAMLTEYAALLEQAQPVACPYCAASHTLGAVYYDQNCAGCVKRMTAPAPSVPRLTDEEIDFHNPWRASLENCINGDNYLRASEYRDLIEELDDLYRIRATERKVLGK